MKKITSKLLSMMALMMVVLLTGCNEPSLIGTWQAKTPDLSRIMKDVNTNNDFKFSNVVGKIVIDETFLDNTYTADMNVTEDDIAMSIGFEISVKYTYKRDGDRVECTYVSHKMDIKDISFEDEEVESILKENGITTDDLKKEFKKELYAEDDESIKESVPFIIKSLDENKLTIEDTDGITDYIRLK